MLWWTETYLIGLTPSWCGQSWGSQQKRGEGPGWSGRWGDWGRMGLEWDGGRKEEWTKGKIKAKQGVNQSKGNNGEEHKWKGGLLSFTVRQVCRLSMLFSQYYYIQNVVPVYLLWVLAPVIVSRPHINHFAHDQWDAADKSLSCNCLTLSLPIPSLWLTFQKQTLQRAGSDIMHFAFLSSNGHP